MTSLSRLALIISLLALSACKPAADGTEVVNEEPNSVAPSTDALPANDAETVEYLMSEVVMPNVDEIWRSVSYVANAQGVTETKPETDEDWSKLRESAETLIAAGDELRNTNREVFSGDFDEATASFQYSPDEIKQLIADNPEPWQNYIQQMQDRTRMTLQAIDLKDLVGLQDFGAQINGACEGCHADYWYRQPAQQ
jgi:hypothetical protein